VKVFRDKVILELFAGRWSLYFQVLAAVAMDHDGELFAGAPDVTDL
jgi:hypothetical protein